MFNYIKCYELIIFKISFNKMISKVNYYAKFKEIIKKDDVESFKGFFNKYVYLFELSDYSLIIKYEAIKILDYYLITMKSSESYFDDLFDYDVLKYLVFNKSDETFNKLKDLMKNDYEQRLNSIEWNESFEEESFEEGQSDEILEENIEGQSNKEFNKESFEKIEYQHPYATVATYCLCYNVNTKLFDQCLEGEFVYFFNDFKYFKTASLDFLKIYLKHDHCEDSLRKLCIHCNEEQLEYLIENYKEYFNNEAHIKTLFNYHQVSFEFLLKHFKLNESICKSIIENYSSMRTQTEAIEACLNTLSLDSMRNELKTYLLNILKKDTKKILMNESLKNKFIEIFKDNISEEFLKVCGFDLN